MASHGRLIATPVFVATAVLASPLSSAASAAPQQGAPSLALRAPSSVESSEILLRRQFGLRDDLEYVRAVDGASTAKRSELGIPLTSAESKDIASRSALGDIAAEISKLEGGDSSFGGVWIDQSTGGTLIINVVPRAGKSGLRPETLRLIATAPKHSLVAAKYSQAELDALDKTIVRGLVGKEPGYSKVATVASDPRSNRVQVTMVGDRGSADSAALPALLRTPKIALIYVSERFKPVRSAPASVPSVPSPSLTRNALSGPLYGGSWISNGGPTAGGNCTAGFSHIFNSLGQWYSVTAGHCGSGTYYQGRNRVGTILGAGHANGFASGGTSNCDCVAVGPISGSRPTKSVLVDGNALFGYTNTGGAAQYVTGQRACLSGAQSADTNNEHIVCGTIVSGSISVRYAEGYTLTDAATVSFEAQQGDSGGPYGNGGAFLGIHGAFNDGLHQGALSKATHIASRFSAQLIY